MTSLGIMPAQINVRDLEELAHTMQPLGLRWTTFHKEEEKNIQHKHSNCLEELDI